MLFYSYQIWVRIKIPSLSPLYRCEVFKQRFPSSESRKTTQTSHDSLYSSSKQQDNNCKDSDMYIDLSNCAQSSGLCVSLVRNHWAGVLANL